MSSVSSEMVSALVERMRGRDEPDDRSSEALQIFQGVARWIPRAISPFMDLYGAMCAALPSEDEIDENDKKNFDRIMKLHPRFPELIMAFKEDPDAYDNFVAMMIESFGNARALDTNAARYGVPTFVPLDPLVDVVQPPITNDKSARGFNHPIVGKLLCPLQLLPEYEADPILFKNQVENATLQFRSHDERNWPSFLYPPGSEYNVNELNKDLFRGPIVIRTLRMIYMGKGSAFTGYRSAPKRSQAEMHGMREVFPEAVAYAAVQAYYGLCSLDGWDTQDRFFKLDVFFYKCVRLFTEDPKDPWVIDTLGFLTRQMPALTRGGKRELPRDVEEDEDGLGGETLVGILAQRARRREAAEEQEQEGEQTGNQVPAEDDLESEDGVGQPLTPPVSSPGPQEGNRSRNSSPTLPRRPTGRVIPPPSPEQHTLVHSIAQQSTVGTSQPRQRQVPSTNQPTSSSQGSPDPSAPSAPPTLVSKSQAGKPKKPPTKQRKRNW